MVLLVAGTFAAEAAPEADLELLPAAFPIAKSHQYLIPRSLRKSRSHKDDVAPKERIPNLRSPNCSPHRRRPRLVRITPLRHPQHPLPFLSLRCSCSNPKKRKQRKQKRVL